MGNLRVRVAYRSVLQSRVSDHKLAIDQHPRSASYRVGGSRTFRFAGEGETRSPAPDHGQGSATALTAMLHPFQLLAPRCRFFSRVVR